MDTLGNMFVAGGAAKRIFKISAGDRLVTTYAGNPYYGSTAENVQATAAYIEPVYRITGDSLGNLYYIDNCRIRKLSLDSGLVSTIVGGASCSYSGDNGPGTSALLRPACLWMNTAGSIIIGDSNSYRVRKFTVSNGLVTTIAGNGTRGFSDNLPATSAMLKSVYDVVGDTNGNIYFSDGSDHKVRKVTATGILITYAGDGDFCCYANGGQATSTDFYNPSGLFLESTGKLYVSIYGRIVVIDPSTTVVTAAIGNNVCSVQPGDSGPASSACLGFTNSIWRDSNLDFYFPQPIYYRIRKVSSSIITTFAGNGDYSFAGDGGPAKGAHLNSPLKTFVDTNGNAYIADVYNCRIRLVDVVGIISTIGGTGLLSSGGDNGPFYQASMVYPRGIWKDSAGNLYIGEINRVRKVSASTNIITTVAGGGGSTTDNILATSYSFSNLQGVWGDSVNNIFIVDSSRHNVKKLSLTTNFLTTIAGTGSSGSLDNVPATDGQLTTPYGIWVDSLGIVFIADTGNHRIRKVQDGIITTFAGTGVLGFNNDGLFATSTKLNSPADVTGDSNGDIYVADSSNCRIRKISAIPAVGNIVSTAVGSGSCTGSNFGWYVATSAVLTRPQTVLLDTNGEFYISLEGSIIRRTVSLCTPTSQPSRQPSGQPTRQPFGRPSSQPSRLPTGQPTAQPNNGPSSQPSTLPTGQPSSKPSRQPSARPTKQPINRPSSQPSGVPTGQPTTRPTSQPSGQPTQQPTSRPSSQPSECPSSQPSGKPTQEPSCKPTTQPTVRPSGQPSVRPSGQPGTRPSRQPTGRPSGQPTSPPSSQPSCEPSGQPSAQPSVQPTAQPAGRPTGQPSGQPSVQPSVRPTMQPTSNPSCQPTVQPSDQPSSQPTSRPSCQPSRRPSSQPSGKPTQQPSSKPTTQPTVRPSGQPSVRPSGQPSSQPSRQPTGRPTGQPTTRPSSQPSTHPSGQPSGQPSVHPTAQPTRRPTSQPSGQPSGQPSVRPTMQPTSKPSCQPTVHPSSQPSAQPNQTPTANPSGHPSVQPSSQPTSQPSGQPNARPSVHPSVQPTRQPSSRPSGRPSSQPSERPSRQPSAQPSSQPMAKPSSQPSTIPSARPSRSPSIQPTSVPSGVPSGQPSRCPTSQPTTRPSVQPSSQPSCAPTSRPSSRPSCLPTRQPSSQPSSLPSARSSGQPSSVPSAQPIGQPSRSPTSQPSNQPSGCPTGQPSNRPSGYPSGVPTVIPSSQPSNFPSGEPTGEPSSGFPSGQPTSVPSGFPSGQPTSLPSNQPISFPTNRPTCVPTGQPSGFPSSSPSGQPSVQPTSSPTSTPSMIPTFQPTIHFAGGLKQAMAGVYYMKDSLNDKSGNGNNGKAHGGISFTSDRFGSEKSSIEFDGSSGYIEVPTKSQDQLITNFTLSFWIYPNIFQLIPGTVVFDKSAYLSETCGWSLIYLKDHIFEFSYNIRHSGRRLAVSSNSSSSVLFDVRDNDWSHIAFVKEFQTLFVYRDGQLVNSTNIPLSESLPYSSLPLIIGTSKEILLQNEAKRNLSYYSGGLDDIFIYDRALSAEEIALLRGLSVPTSFPSGQPSNKPSLQPTSNPTRRPTAHPTSIPSSLPTRRPSGLPSSQPTVVPSVVPTSQPSSCPSNNPTNQPTAVPSGRPSVQPSSQPVGYPTTQPSNKPSGYPTSCPSTQPSRWPSSCPTSVPSMRPSSQPSGRPTQQPIGKPSSVPSSQPITTPTMVPSVQPSSLPTNQPTSFPSTQPSSQPTKNRFHCTVTDNKFYSPIRDDCVPCAPHSFLNHTGDDTCYCSGGYSQVGIGLTVNCTICSQGRFHFLVVPIVLSVKVDSSLIPKRTPVNCVRRAFIRVVRVKPSALLVQLEELLPL
jgi:hypothetical protein